MLAMSASRLSRNACRQLDYCSHCRFRQRHGRWPPWTSSMACRRRVVSTACILVVVDKLTKCVHFLPLRHPYTATKVAELFVDNIFKLHSMPEALVSDRDPVFTSHFRQSVFRATGTQLKLSTANHPETDGQIERVNQSIECYLRCFISSHPHHWVKWLSLCEHWYNTNWHASLGKSPFELLYGHQPRYFGMSASDKIAYVDVQEWLQERPVVLASCSSA